MYCFLAYGEIDRLREGEVVEGEMKEEREGETKKRK